MPKIDLLRKIGEFEAVLSGVRGDTSDVLLLGRLLNSLETKIGAGARKDELLLLLRQIDVALENIDGDTSDVVAMGRLLAEIKAEIENGRY